MLTTVERMDEEFVKILKECDAHSNEYVERLRDESRVSAIIDLLQSYIERQNLHTELCRLYIRKIDHLYYRVDEAFKKATVRRYLNSFLLSVIHYIFLFESRWKETSLNWRSVR